MARFSKPVEVNVVNYGDTSDLSDAEWDRVRDMVISGQSATTPLGMIVGWQKPNDGNECLIGVSNQGTQFFVMRDGRILWRVKG